MNNDTYADEMISIPLKEYQDLNNMKAPSLYQQALGEIIGLISNTASVTEIAEGASAVLTKHQIHIKFR